MTKHHDLTVQQVRALLKENNVKTIYISVKVTYDDVSTIEISKTKAIKLFRHFGSREIADVTYYAESKSLWIG